MAQYTTKFNIGDTAYYIKHDDVFYGTVSDIYVHDNIAAFGVALISYRLNYPLSSSGVGSSMSGKTLFHEVDLCYLSEVQAEMKLKLTQKLANVEGMM